jgi:hypothetical protein
VVAASESSSIVGSTAISGATDETAVLELDEGGLVPRLGVLERPRVPIVVGVLRDLDIEGGLSEPLRVATVLVAGADASISTLASYIQESEGIHY